MKYCECGNELKDNTEICDLCGKKLKNYTNLNVKNSRFIPKSELCWMSIYMLLGMLTFLIPSLDNPADLISGYSNSEIIIGVISFIIIGAIYGLAIYYIPSFFIYRIFKNRQDNIDKQEVINNTLRTVKEYFRNKDLKIIKSKLEISKMLSLSTYEMLIVDDKNKKFLFYSPRYCDFYKPIKKMLENGTLTINELEQIKSKNNLPSLIKDLYVPYTFPKVYNFNDLNRVDVIDMTTTDETRSYTMESKSGDALMGAIAGSLLSETIFNEYAAAGAVIGASGERKITENVDKKISYEFRVNIYLNDINESCKSIKLYREYELRELIGTLEFIKNNKG